MKKQFLLLIGCICLSFASFSEQPTNEHLKQSHDVGWLKPSTLSNVDIAANAIAFDVNINHVKILIHLQESPKEPKLKVDGFYAILPENNSYVKQKFVSHNRKTNRYNIRTYGIQNDKEKQLLYIPTVEGSPTIPFVSTIWQWLSSNVKDQA